MMEFEVFYLIAAGLLVSAIICAISRFFTLNRLMKESLKRAKPPKTFIAFTKIKRITPDEVAQFDRLCSEIKSIVETGKTAVTSTQFNLWYGQSRQYLYELCFIKTFPITSIFLVLLTFPIGFIPLIIFVIFLVVSGQALSKIESVFMSYFNQTLIIGGNPSKAFSQTDELKTLHDLKTAGAITEIEFKEAKTAILRKIA